MSKPEVGRVVPNFKLPSTGGRTLELKTLRSQNVVVYFYPKDNTSGCTTESCDFKASHQMFRRRNTVILGVSRDSIASHERFRSKYGFPFHLLADTDEKACRLFDVIREKNMYGRKVLGIERSTFLIDEHGKLKQEWRRVKVRGHVEQVLTAVRAL